MKANLKETEEYIKINKARTEANHKEMMDKLDAHHERMIACLGKTEAMDLEVNPDEIQSEAEHRGSLKNMLLWKLAERQISCIETRIKPQNAATS
jgi:hypothetical protein